MNTLQARLEAVDWAAYEQRILALTQSGIDAFVAATPGARIFQLGIWTDLEARISSISIETSPHAREYVHATVVRFRDEKLYARADELIIAGRSSNPANFLFRDAAECYHTELEPLRKHLGSSTRFNTADAYLAERLKAARQSILNKGLLAAAPHEETVWFGISSQESWYDHEVAVNL